MKRRLLASILSLVMVLSLLPTAALADDSDGQGNDNQTELPNLTNPETSGTSGGVDWKVEDGTLIISKASVPESGYTAGQMKENYGTFQAPTETYANALKDAGYEQPDNSSYFHYHGTNTWVSDSPWKFLGDRIEKIVIEDEVTSIGARAFRLPNITEVSIPSTVTSIGYLAFEACEKLEIINWTGDWSSHAPMTYEGFVSRCASLGEGTEFTEWLPECFNAMSSSIEDTLFTVDFAALDARMTAQNEAEDYQGKVLNGKYPNAAFQGMPNVTAIELTTKYGVRAFSGTGVAQVTFADGVTEIPQDIFWNCEKLTSITIPATISKIGSRAFCNSGLKSLVFEGKTCPEVSETAFNGVILDSLSLNDEVTDADALKLIATLIKSGAVTENTKISPQKYADYDINAEDVTVDGSQGSEINHTNYPKVKHLVINGSYTSKDMAFGNSSLDKETIETLVIDAQGKSVTITKGAFLRAPLKSVKITAENLTFTGDAAFLNNMLLTRVDLTGVANIAVTEGGKRTFDINSSNGSDKKDVPTRYVYFNNDSAYQALKSHFSGNTSTYYIVTNGGSVDSETDSFGAVVKSGYSAQWYASADCSGSAVETPEAGKVYYAKWTKDDSVLLISSPDADNGKTTSTYDPNGAVTLSVQNPGDNWLYTWMKDGSQIPAAKSSLTLYAPSESGTYTVKVMADGNSTDVWTSNAIEVTINKADGAASVSMADWTYGEAANEPVPESATNGIDAVTYQYKKTDADDSTYDNSVPTNAGSYTVKATFPATDNYNEVTATDTFTIAKATPILTISPDVASLRGSGRVTLTVTKVPTDAVVNVTCDDSSVEVKDNNDGTYTVALPNTTKTYTFTASIEQSDTYTAASSAPCTVSVTRYVPSTPGSSVTVPATANGSVTVSPSTASKGTTVTVTTKPNEGYELGSLEVLDKNGNALALKDLGNGKYSFTMPDGKVTVNANFVKASVSTGFADVPANAYYADAVKWAVDKGVTNGLSDTLFGPYEPCTRAQIVTFLWRAAGSPEPKTATSKMTDLDPNAYYYKAVLWAIENGITAGMTDTTFAPNATCTRGQSVTFLYRALGKKASSSANFSDVAANAFYADAVNWAVENNVTNGTSATTFSPNADCTRAEIVTFLYRAYQGK